MRPRLANARDDELSVYAFDNDAALLTHDHEFTQARRKKTIGRHVRLDCRESDAVGILRAHIDEVVAHLERERECVLVVRPSGVTFFAARWPRRQGSSGS